MDVLVVDRIQHDNTGFAPGWLLERVRSLLLLLQYRYLII